jgi:hypothetical protein
MAPNKHEPHYPSSPPLAPGAFDTLSARGITLPAPVLVYARPLPSSCGPYMSSMTKLVLASRRWQRRTEQISFFVSVIGRSTCYDFSASLSLPPPCGTC